MLGIQINGESLDLPPGTSMELQNENPFLQFDNNLLGEYSLPFQVISNAKNNRLLGYAGVGQTKADNVAVPAILYDNSLQLGSGTIKKEKLNVHLNKVSKGTLNCYYLSKASGFWQDIKELKLREVTMGGDRSFAWAGLSTITTGFWKHIHEVAAGAVNDYDYAFFPVKNEGWIIGTVYPPEMNKMYYDSGETYPMHFPNTYGGLYEREMNRIVPFPYLHYVLTSAVTHAGWTIEGDILSDADFLKITMLNFRAIDYCYAKVSSGVYSSVYRNPVVFNLQDHMPDITVAQFLIALKNRFGWWYDVDNITKKITIREVKDLVSSAAEDYTDYSSPLISKSILQDLPIYALRSGTGGALNFSAVNLQADVDSSADLPTAAEALYGHVRLVVEENTHYICQQNEGTEAWEWVILDHNIHDYEPTGFTDEIVTDSTLAGNEYHTAYMDYIPRFDNQGEWNGRTDGEDASWGIHLVFYHGPRDNTSGDPIPYASHHIYDATGVKVGNWSLAFKAKDADGNEVGLYDLNWKEFLNMLNSPEEVEHTLYLPLHKYLQLVFSKRIVVDGIELFIKQIKTAIPYKGQVNCVSARV